MKYNTAQWCLLIALTVCLHFWGCNLRCRACLCYKEIYDCHLQETKEAIFQPGKAASFPEKFFTLAEVMEVLRSLAIRQVILMGAEPTIDPELPKLAEILRQEFDSHNILLTNGFRMPPFRRHLHEVSCLVGNEELKYEVVRVI